MDSIRQCDSLTEPMERTPSSITIDLRSACQPGLGLIKCRCCMPTLVTTIVVFASGTCLTDAGVTFETPNRTF